jgi:fumarate reductase subunit D
MVVTLFDICTGGQALPHPLHDVDKVQKGLLWLRESSIAALLLTLFPVGLILGEMWADGTVLSLITTTGPAFVLTVATTFMIFCAPLSPSHYLHLEEQTWQLIEHTLYGLAPFLSAPTFMVIQFSTLRRLGAEWKAFFSTSVAASYSPAVHLTLDFPTLTHSHSILWQCIMPHFELCSSRQDSQEDLYTEI